MILLRAHSVGGEGMRGRIDKTNIDIKGVMAWIFSILQEVSSIPQEVP